MPSASILEEKKKLVETLSEKIREAKSFVLADYRGLSVEQDTEMRVAIRKAGLEYKVYKNTLTKLAAKENGYEALNEYLDGPTAIAFSSLDPILPSKILTEFAKKFEKFEIKAGVIEGKIFNDVSIKEIAALPSREELIAKVLGSLNAPITGFVNVLNGNLRGLVVALDAIRKQKEQ
jgi:large subunit ribosomal protein L10